MGPGVSVLLAHDVSSSDTELIARTVAMLSGGDSAWDEIHVVTTEPIGGIFRARMSGDSRPFSIALSDLDEDERVVVSELMRSFGVHARAQVDIHALCNKWIDHRILGEIALHLSVSSAGSIVSFHGDLSDYRRHGGTFVSLPYETASGATALASYGDAIFLRSWLADDEFHMIK